MTLMNLGMKTAGVLLATTVGSMVLSSAGPAVTVIIAVLLAYSITKKRNTASPEVTC